MIPRNCLSEVLDRLRHRGGYFVARRSEHWCGMHVLWMSPEGEMEHYCPPEKLRSPLEAFIGYEGAWMRCDKTELAKPIDAWSMVANSWVLALATTGWWIAGMWKRR